MGLNQQDRDNLTKNWDKVSDQVKTTFGLSDADVQQGRNDPDALVSSIASKTGQSEDQIRQQMTTIAQSAGGQGGSQSQS